MAKSAKLWLLWRQLASKGGVPAGAAALDRPASSVLRHVWLRHCERDWMSSTLDFFIVHRVELGWQHGQSEKGLIHIDSP